MNFEILQPLLEPQAYVSVVLSLFLVLTGVNRFFLRGENKFPSEALGMISILWCLAIAMAPFVLLGALAHYITHPKPKIQKP